jgi:hypothetical protein
MRERLLRRLRSRRAELRAGPVPSICRAGVDEAVRIALFPFLPPERRPRPPRRVEPPLPRRLRLPTGRPRPRPRDAMSYRDWRALASGRPTVNVRPARPRD